MFCNNHAWEYTEKSVVDYWVQNKDSIEAASNRYCSETAKTKRWIKHLDRMAYTNMSPIQTILN